MRASFVSAIRSDERTQYAYSNSEAGSHVQK